MVARVDPAGLRTCASCQSKVQALPVHSESVVVGQYQKPRVVFPLGTVMVWLIELSDSGSVPESTPSSAEEVPEWGFVAETIGAGLPDDCQGAEPFSNPPLITTE